ncbi:MAG: DNA repair protein RadA [Desulfobacterales bacterium]|nr:DNA repair protein RadA [Desulfobacterales bacterium]
MKAKKPEVVYICQGCGYQSRKWLGRCPDCREWQSLVEERVTASRGGGTGTKTATAIPVPLVSAPEDDDQRSTTGIAELDRVLGNGVVPGSMILIGGDPGIGKSTLMLHMLAGMAAQGCRVLYVSGEESVQQIKMRARRLNALHPDLFLAMESNVEAIIGMADHMQPGLLVVDSIQTLFTEEFPSAPGSVTQVRESAARLMTLAKTSRIPVVLVGHVTKDGAIAGPRVLEHMVDCVLYFEGDRGHAFRILRTVKNRYGSTNEIGVFEMKEEGLVQVDNPSEIFLAERSVDVPGSVVMPSIEGSRPILVEVQALVSSTNFGTPRRTAIGADPQRLALLTAVLEKKAGLSLVANDIFLNIAGGIRIDEPALDLGVISAIASGFLERPIPAATVVCGEVGLAGEVRAVGQIEMRLKEAYRLGFTRFILPRSNAARLGAKVRKQTPLELIGVATVTELLDRVF